MIESLLFREDNSGVSQGGQSFRLLSSAYSFGTQTPRESAESAELVKANKAVKSFKVYILGQDEEINMDPTVQSIKLAAQSTRATRKRKEDIFEDFLCDLFSGSLTEKLVQRVNGAVDNDDLAKLQAFCVDVEKVNIDQLKVSADGLNLTNEQLKQLSAEQIRYLSAGGKGLSTEMAKSLHLANDRSV